MIQSLRQRVKHRNWQEHQLGDTLYLVDWETDSELRHQGCMCYTTATLPSTAPASLCLRPHIALISLALEPYAWGKQGVGQCDAVVLPREEGRGNALLLVEMKYTAQERSLAKHKAKALKQIVDTKRELELHCPLAERRIYGLLCFPRMRTDIFGATLYSREEWRQVYTEHRIELMVTNHATFASAQEVNNEK